MLMHIGQSEATFLGPVWAAASEQGLVAVDWAKSQREFVNSLEHRFGKMIFSIPDDFTAVALRQIKEYLDGMRREFTLPINWAEIGDFQERALRAVMAIPYGQTTSYKAIALQINQPGAVRAVGRANATNPMPLVIPCHRVLGVDGSLRGYGGPGGIALKARLLEMEKGQRE